MIWWLVIILALALTILWLISRRQRLGAKEQSRVASKWQEIEQLAEDDRWKEAVIEADKVVDYVLKRMNIKGQTMGERMRNAQKIIVNYNDLWEAHKVRNRLVHEIEFKLNEVSGRRVLSDFKRTLKGLKII